jgi:hypothetical protein
MLVNGSQKDVLTIAREPDVRYVPVRIRRQHALETIPFSPGCVGIRILSR